MSRLLMTVSAAWMAACGVLLSFAPHEVLSLAGAGAAPAMVLALQLLGALQLGGAMTNWMAKRSLIGGIFGRPLALGNLAHFAMAALALARMAAAGNALLWPPTLLYAALALGFYVVTFGRAREASCS